MQAGNRFSTGARLVGHACAGDESGQSMVKEIDIRWPSGIRQTLHDVKGDQNLTSDEGAKRIQQGL
jgi:ASPIC/UnbV protein